MSIIYGLISDNLTVLDKLDSFCESKFKLSVSSINVSNTSVALRVAGRGGCFGRAENKDLVLVYSGFVQAPFPDWPEGRPIDAPDEVAARLLTRYLASKETFLESVIGQYVVVIAQKQIPRVLVACDSTGFRKAFYTNTPKGIFFSTSLHMLSAAFPAGVLANRALEDFYLGYEFVPEPQTIYRDVNMLQAGQLTIDSKKTIVTRFAEKKEPANVKKNIKVEEKVIDDLYEVFMETMKLLLPNNKRVGVALGGFDSALVASALTRLGKKVETYSFSFDRREMNQGNIKEFCHAIPVDHHWVKIDPDVICKGLAEYELWFNQIASQPNYLIQFSEVIEAMHQRGIKHAFTGDGCDEIFLGYPIVYKRAMIFSRTWRLPNSIRDLLLWLTNINWLERHLGQPLRLLRNIITILSRKEPMRSHITNRIFDDSSLLQIRNKINPSQCKPSEQILEELATDVESLSTVRRAYHGKSAPGLNSTRNEGSIARTGLTIQSPFTHPLLKAYVNSLPDELHRPKNLDKHADTGKHVLMQMAQVHQLLPSSVIYQPKASPVTSPVDYWFMDQLQELPAKLLKDLPFDYNARYAASLNKYKFAEELYRRISMGRFAFKNLYLLITYARFFSDHGGRL